MEGSLAPFVLFKALLGFGLPIAICIQQLIVTKRAIRDDREAAARAAEAEARAAVAVVEVAPAERERQREAA